jgi:hypothetical protein
MIEENGLFTCLTCAMTSHNPNDIRERYCGACHHWCDDRDVQDAVAGVYEPMFLDVPPRGAGAASRGLRLSRIIFAGTGWLMLLVCFIQLFFGRVDAAPLALLGGILATSVICMAAFEVASRVKKS